MDFTSANSEQKETLREIMTLILTKATSTLNNNNSYYYSKSLYGFDISTMILEWMEINYDNISSLDELSILKELINLYYSILVDEPLKSINQNFSTYVKLDGGVNIFRNWLFI